MKTGNPTVSNPTGVWDQQMTTLAITYRQPVNASSNVTIQNVNVNVSAVMGSESTVGIGVDYQSIVTTIMRQGIWNGDTYIPSGQITLVTLN